MDPGHSPKDEFCGEYHRARKNKYDNFNESKRHRDLTEIDVVVGEFSFDDAFGYGDDIEVKTHPKQANPKKPEALLKEIAEGVKKAIAKVGS